MQTDDMERIEIEVLKPAQENIPLHLYNMALIFSSDISPETVVRFQNETQKSKIIEKYNAYAEGQVADYLHDIINESPKFNIINKEFITENIYSGDIVNWKRARFICDSLQTEGILFVKDFETVIAIYEKNLFGYPYYRSQYKYAFRYIPGMIVEILDPYNMEVTDQQRIQEPRYWETYNSFEINPTNFFQEQSDLLAITNKQTALKYAKKITPFWDKESRKFYAKGNSDFVKAEKYLRSDNWQEARIRWVIYSGSERRKYANYANYNLALAYEMEGNLEKALYHANYSYAKYNNYYAGEYARILENRIKDQEILKKQLGE